MFIEQGVHPENKFWKYIIGSLVIILASTLGQIPLMVAVFIKSLSEGKNIPTNTEDLMKVFDSNLTLFLILFSFVFALTSIYYVVRYFHNQSFISITTSRDKVDWNRILFSFSIWTFFTIASTVGFYFFSPESFVFNFKPIPFLILVVIAIVMIPIQTSTEEYVFRGYLMQGFGIGTLNKKFVIGILYTILFALVFYLLESLLFFKDISEFINQIISISLSISFIFFIDFFLTKVNFFESSFYSKLYNKSKTKFVPLFITSIIFGSMHLFNPEVEKLGYIIMVYYVGTGFLLGIMTLMDEGMELSLGFHAANNLIGALLVTADWSVFQTNSILKDISEPSAGFDVILPVIIIYPLLLYIFSKKYNWTNWTEKLTGKIEYSNIKLINTINEINHDTNLS